MKPRPRIPQPLKDHSCNPESMESLCGECGVLFRESERSREQKRRVVYRFERFYVRERGL